MAGASNGSLDGKLPIHRLTHTKSDSMTKNELNAGLALAKDKSFRCIDDNGKHLIDTSMFDGFGLHDFKPITCTVENLAALIRWQCFQMNGGIDQASLQEIATIGKKKFTVLGVPN